MVWSWRCIGSEHDIFVSDGSPSIPLQCLRAEGGFLAGKGHYGKQDTLVDVDVLVEGVAVFGKLSETEEQSHPRQMVDF